LENSTKNLKQQISKNPDHNAKLCYAKTEKNEFLPSGLQ